MGEDWISFGDFMGEMYGPLPPGPSAAGAGGAVDTAEASTRLFEDHSGADCDGNQEGHADHGDVDEDLLFWTLCHFRFQAADGGEPAGPNGLTFTAFQAALASG